MTSIASSEVPTAALADDPNGAPVAAGDDVLQSGGLDEPVAEFDEFTTMSPAGTPTQQLRLDVGPRAALAELAGGTRFGTFVHSVLEDVDVAAGDLDDHVRDAVTRHAARAGLVIATADVTSGLVAALETPLGPMFSGRCLRDIPAADRLAELTFDFPLVPASRPHERPVEAAAIGEVLLATLPRHDVLRPFATQLSADLAGLQIAGWMHGSIDAVLRIRGSGETGAGSDDSKYFVIDYKTNRLHEPGSTDPVAAYRPDLLVHAMEHSKYPLQALIYVVAVHRYLRWRLGSAYDPDRHLGGIGYLFLRGMVGPTTPTVDGVAHGVFAWRPPTTTILALDHLFASGCRT